MNFCWSSIILFVLSPLLSYGQKPDKIADEAFTLVRMVQKFHVTPREVNGAFSTDVYSGMLNKMDHDKLFFTQTDISRLNIYANILDKEILQRKSGYLNLFISIYQQRLKQADSLIDVVCKKQFDFFSAEKFTVAENASYPQSFAGLQQKLYKKMKAEALEELMDGLPDNFKTFTPGKQKKYLDSAEVSVRKKTAESLKRKIAHALQNPDGITQYIGNIYCEVIASCFDPHTEFFPPMEKENFESELGKQAFHFGFRIKEDKNGGVIIDNLEPGSPAFKGGKLNKGDKFMSVQWEGGKPVNVADMSGSDFANLLDEDNHKRVVFEVKKADGSVIKISMEKEQVEGDDDDKVKSFILKGNNTIGYIYLPAFYEDWDTRNDGLNGCANDVGREVLKLKKENIQGLILDLRYNGGGSMKEAAELAGIFIDAGPVAQIKGREEKVYVLKDVNRGTIYDGPLVILVNGYSASASELIAGTLQDYNRAVIIGAPTYGKATAQVVLPMDTTVTPETIKQKQTENYIKITISKLYRVNGNTAQFSGVQPDIVLPDILDAYITKEADEPYALRPNVMGANKYYTPYEPLPVKDLAAYVQTEVDTSKYFNTIKDLVAYSKQKKTEKDILVNFKEALADYDLHKTDINSIPDTDVQSKKFIVQNNQYEIAKLQADTYLNELNEEFSKQVSADRVINIAYDVLLKLKKQ